MTTLITADNGTVSGSAGLKQSADSSGILALATGSGTTAVTIDASQNVGIGATPSSWSAAYKAVQLPNGGVLANDGSQSVYIGQNWYGNSGNKYIATAAATLYAQGAGQHQWFNAPSGTAGNAISFTQAMTLDASGNLLVGATTSVANGMTIGNSTGGRSINGVVNGGGFSISATDTVNSPSAGFATGHLTSTSQYAVRVGSTGGLQLSGAGAASWTALSDETTKDIIEPIANAANKVCQLRAVIGKYKTDEEGVRRSFLMAQDVQAVLPEAVSVINKELGSEETALGLAYTDVIPLLVAAIQELKAIVDTQAAKITALTTRITALEQK